MSIGLGSLTVPVLLFSVFLFIRHYPIFERWHTVNGNFNAYHMLLFQVFIIYLLLFWSFLFCLSRIYRLLWHSEAVNPFSLIGWKHCFVYNFILFTLLLHILFIFFSRFVVFLFYKYFRLCFIFFDYSFEPVLNVSIVCLSICCYALLGGCHSQVGFHRYWLLFIQTTSVLMKSNCTETLFICPKEFRSIQIAAHAGFYWLTKTFVYNWLLTVNECAGSN